MAAPTHGHYHASHLPNRHGPTTIAPPVNVPPKGTFPSGTALTVGAHKCTIERYLSEGGFAHVYLVRLMQTIHGSDVAVLKRVAVPDKEALASMRTEVDTMKRLKGHQHIVTYIDSHASHLKNGGYEVFLLMEYCSGGGLIDFMNTRLQNRLTEPEVLKIFSDVTQGVACMHYLKPPLLHRDLKVENVLLASSGGYKVCDFGSCSAVKPAPQTAEECKLLEEDIGTHTTLQYRSPEMVDVFRRLPIDEKSDIWALGVLLYKLCYYTTPFEVKGVQGQLAILNARFTFPPQPVFSDRLKKLIASMLRELPHQRPNIYQIIREVCYMRGREVPIQDIYGDQPVHNLEKQLPTPPAQQPIPSVVAYEAPAAVEKQLIPEIAPMRRGRPTKSQPPSSASHSAGTSRTRVAVPSPQARPTTSDPFAALDKRTGRDELSNRFPSVEQFSLLHDSGNKFQFGDRSSPPPDRINLLADHVTDKLVANTFGTSPPKSEITHGHSGETRLLESMSRGLTGSSSYARPVLYEPQPKRPVMVSTGTMTSPSPSPSPPRYGHSPQNQALTPTVPSSIRERPSELYINSSRHNPQKPLLLDISHAQGRISPMANQPSSSWPSSDMSRSPSQSDALSPTNPTRSKSANSKQRPHSVYVESNLEFLRDLDSPSSQGPSTGGFPSISNLRNQNSGRSTISQSEHIGSNVEFLRAMEAEADAHKPEKRSASSGFVSKHIKRASMPAMLLPKTGCSNKLGGKFGDAFRRFERNAAGSAADVPISPEPVIGLMHAISGSQNASDGGDEWEVSSQEIPPEVKRELEKRQLSQEEKRVAAAAAEYKRQVANRKPGEGDQPRSRNRANSIQKRVHALLNETKEAPPKTAEGYGRYTAETSKPQVSHSQPHTSTVAKLESYRITQSNSGYRPSTALETLRIVPTDATKPLPSGISSKSNLQPAAPAPAPIISQGPLARPPPPPKPVKLRTGGSSASSKGPLPLPSPLSQKPVGGDDIPSGRVRADRDGTSAEDWERSFAKRYPSLSGLEMVETAVGTTAATRRKP